MIKAFIFSLALLLPIGNEISSYVCDEYKAYACEIAEMYDLSPELIVAMIEKESSGKRKAVSSANCIGLMQISPKWQKDRMEKLGVTDLTDAYSNILVGCDLVAELFDKYGDVYAVLMAYNEGEYSGAIERAENGEYSAYATKIVERWREMQFDGRKDVSELLHIQKP